jgi:hypothetical protein
MTELEKIPVRDDQQVQITLFLIAVIENHETNSKVSSFYLY